MTERQKRLEAGKQRRADMRLQKARAAMVKLTPSQQAAIFREFSRCACSDIGKLVRASPSAGLGAIVGGVVGALLGPPMKLEEEKPKNAIGDGMVSRLLGPARRGV